MVLGQNAYWTGYYTSRAAFKKHERDSDLLLQAAKQANVLGQLGQFDELTSLKRALGVAQHHDAITGTAKQPVDSDYHVQLRQVKLFQLVTHTFKA